VVVSAQAAVTHGDGYQAAVTLRWHEYQAIPSTAIFPDCLALVPSEDFLYQAAVIEGEVEFQTVGGFEWPSQAAIEVQLDDSDLDYTCTQDSTWSGPSSSTVRVSPETGTTFAIMVIQESTRTPNSPEGEFEGTRHWPVRLTGYGSDFERCELSGAADSDATDTMCTLLYPG
jgi:hypothetical protein